ncbi:hypothetical protein AB9M75_06755 [Lactobacillus sp. AN1001]
MNLDEYTLLKLENQMLLKDSIIDLATLMGHTTTEPISSHIFCLELDFTKEEHDKILLCLNLLSDKRKLKVKEIQKELIKTVPKIAELSNNTFNGMLKIFLKQFNINLKVPDLI